MFKRSIVALLLMATAFSASAIEYTDVYYDPNQAGWGAFLVQSNTIQFMAIFIYGSDSKPTWYTATLSDDGTGKYTGTLYATTGTYFASPWQGYNYSSAGTATFQPTDAYHAKLTYSVNGVGTINKTVQRQVLASYPMAGNYSGSAAGSISGCQDPTGNDPAFRASYGLTVAQVADTSATLTFSFVDTKHNGIVCTLLGPLTHFGRLYKLNAQQRCTGPGQDGSPYAVTVDSLHPTGQGIEGHLTASLGAGCMASLHFSAVQNVNN